MQEAGADVLDRASHRLLDERAVIDRDLAERLVELSDDHLPALIALAHQVRLAWMGPAVEVESIISAKTGGCPENCTFCSQSARYDTEVVREPMLPLDKLVELAQRTKDLGGTEFCIVVAVRGPNQRMLQQVIDAARAIRSSVDIEVAASLGLLKEGQAERLAAGGIHRYNHNLEAGPGFFPRICTTHRFEDRVNTCRMVTDAGMELCSGGIFGMGETWSDRLDLAFELRDLGAHEIPCNFLNPRPGTPLGDAPLLRPLEALKCVAMFRLVNPDCVLRYSGGREVVLRDLQAYGMLAGANGLIVGNYLTTLGRSAEVDLAMLADLDMPVASKPLTGTGGRRPLSVIPVIA
ncbi:MAG: biotin synthase BioB [Candidatus Dormibacteraeota bacterium]|uniref:Biotin synthase n=1 Tax=Candidatus Amunia macphersoniae TaxID=3127014 RepID=A0A934KJC4_9BACT|nr:biotin synthase BioB [Candidatus Dormibacteraeota bacterium]